MIITIANRACSLIFSFVKQCKTGTWILPVNVCPDVPLTLCEANVQFEFVDINPDTLCIDETKVLEKLNGNKKNYSGIIFVRTYGYVYNTKEFFSKCRDLCPDISIIDDRCLCLPEISRQTIEADLLLFSTGHCKQIDLGGGGFSISPTEIKLEKNKVYCGIDEENIYKQSYSRGEPLLEIPKGWLDVKSHSLTNEKYFSEIEKLIVKRQNHRNKLNNIYSDNLPKEIQFSSKFQDWRFNINIPSNLKSKILQTLFDNGLFASNHYHSTNKLFDKDVFPVSDQVYNTTINLFNDFYYTEDMTHKTCNIITNVLIEYINRLY